MRFFVLIALVLLCLNVLCRPMENGLSSSDSDVCSTDEDSDFSSDIEKMMGYETEDDECSELEVMIADTDFALDIDPSFLGVDADGKHVLTREGCLKIDYFTQTNWGEMLSNPNTQLPWTKEGKLFTQRFRVNWDIYQHIVVLCKKKDVFGKVTCPTKVRVPIEFKILTALRILGRGNCADDISEMSDARPSSINSFFESFVMGFSRYYFKDYVYPPEGEALQRTLDSYAAVGIPGGIGSMDCTHLHLDKCPVELYNLCKGKEKYPTVAFNCVVDHCRFIHHVSDAYFGATNDIQICGDDDYPLKIRAGLYKDTEFNLYRADGTLQTCKGAYIICDGGMPKEGCFMDPQRYRMNRSEVLFSEWLESIRKDVECTFGILKMRFRYLRGRIQHHAIKVVEAAFKVCCMIHNMIFVYDGKSGDTIIFMAITYWTFFIRFA